MKLILALVALALVSSCAYNPVKTAETPEQKAFALAGTYQAYQSAGLKIVRNPNIPEQVKVVIRQIDAQATPIAHSLLDATLKIEDIRRQIAAGTSTNDELRIAVAEMDRWYAELQPLVSDLIIAIKGA